MIFSIGERIEESSTSGATVFNRHALHFSNAIHSNGPTLITWKADHEHRQRGNQKEWLCRPVPSVLELIEDIHNDDNMLAKLRPERLWLTHGDLHFGNILVDLNDLDDPVFKLIDANLQVNGRDIAYDLGKLLHSCDGLYDFIHQDGVVDVTVTEHLSKHPPDGDVGKRSRLPHIAMSIGNGPVVKSLGGGGSGAEVVRYVEVGVQLALYKYLGKEFAT